MATPQTSQASLGESRLFTQASFPEMYEQLLVAPLFRPWVDSLLDDVELGPGDRVLDLACGTGVVARVAAQRLGGSGAVVGVDVNPGMLGVARQADPAIDWREGNASSLPLDDGETFDVVVCQQGFQFFPDLVEAARQIRRALRSGGRVGVSTWRPDREYPIVRGLREVAERELGPIDDRRHSLGDPAPIEAALRQVGIRDVRSKQSSRTIRFDDGNVFVRLNAMALVAMSPASAGLDEEARKRLIDVIVEDSSPVVRTSSDETGFRFEIGTNVVLGRAP